MKSIKEDSSDTASDYLTLSDLEQKRGNLEQAENYLQKANSVSIDNDFVPATIAYHYYKINKERDDYKRALSFYEEYVAAEDSLMNISKSVDIYDTEQKYEHLKLHNENIRLLLKGQRNYTFILILLFLCALLIIVYLATIRRKNRSLLKQQEKINTLNQSIYQLYAELRRKSDELIQLQNTQYSSVKMQVEYENVKKEVDSLRSRLFELRESKILNSNLAKKIKKISQTVQPNHSEAPVSEKMWIDIEVLMMEVYPSVIKVLKDAACHHDHTRAECYQNMCADSRRMRGPCALRADGKPDDHCTQQPQHDHSTTVIFPFSFPSCLKYLTATLQWQGTG